MENQSGRYFGDVRARGVFGGAGDVEAGPCVAVYSGHMGRAGVRETEAFWKVSGVDLADGERGQRPDVRPAGAMGAQSGVCHRTSFELRDQQAIRAIFVSSGGGGAATGLPIAPTLATRLWIQKFE